MGSACGRPVRREAAAAAPTGSLRRMTELAALPLTSKGPPTLLALCVSTIANNLEQLAPLKLSAEMAALVVKQLESRAWLDLDALRCLSGCTLYELELPGLLQHSAADCMAAIASHAELERLDISSASTLTAGALAPLPGLRALRELNLSGCTSLTDGEWPGPCGGAGGDADSLHPAPSPRAQIRAPPARLRSPPTRSPLACAAALAHVSGLGSLQMLKLDSIPRLTDDGVAKLEKLTSLRWLSVAGCPELGAAAAASIGRLGSSLRYLSAQKCSRFDDAALPHLLQLKQLHTLKLGWCFRLTAKGLARLAELTTLTSLDVAHTKLDDAALVSLSPLRKLRELCLRGTCVSDQGVCRIGGMRSLEALSLQLCAVTSNAAPGLLQLPRLRELDLANTEIGDAGLAALVPLRRLESLSLDSCKLSVDGLGCLGSFRRMRRLDLSDVEAPGFTLGLLGSLRSLTSLNLFYACVTDADVACLQNMPRLCDLNLDSRFITDAAMPGLGSLPSLTKLDLFGARITDAGAAHLRTLRALRHIELCGGAITDDGVCALAPLLELRSVNLSQNSGITDAGAASLSRLPMLELLNLSNTGVGGGALPSLQSITSLTSLALHGCHFPSPKAGAAALRASLPRLLSLGIDEAD